MSPYATDESWFKIGRLQVTSTIGVILIGALGMLAWVFNTNLPNYLLYAPQFLSGGQVWRVFTWPLADGISLWSILNLVLLWYFGRDIESRLGKNKMAWLYGGIWLALTLATSATGLLLPGAYANGLGLVEFIVLLLWIAEYPTRRFFFNIPAWVFGAVIVGLQVLQYIGLRMWPMLVNLVISIILVAIVARSLGLLSSYSWIPGGPSGTARKAQRHRAARPQPRAQQRRMSDSQRIDEILDKINAEGISALTKAERSELEKLRRRRQ